MKDRFSILRAPADETPEGGGTTTPPAAPETPASPPETEPVKTDETDETAEEPEAPAAPAAPAEKAPRPGLLQLAQAAVLSKASLINANLKLDGTVRELADQVDDLTQRLDAEARRAHEAESQLSQLRAERAELEQSLSDLLKEAKSAELQAAEIVAGQFGVDPGKLPAAAVPGESREELMAALNAETDPSNRFKLAEKINQLDAGKRPV
jgi:DNA repair exonuclease SbcCD ATPase subunit